MSDEITRSQLLPLHFTDRERFGAELEFLFHDGWQFACLRRDVPNHDDYALVTIGRLEVIVQNVDGALRAFSNVCPHRFSAIRTEARGNAKLQCPYHLWTFDGDGRARSIPHRRDAVLTPELADTLRLETWNVDMLGEMVFVSRRPDLALAQSFGGISAWLSALSTNFAEEVDCTEQEIAANWKLVIQNTLEFDHVFSVHEQTFARIVKTPIALSVLPAAPPHLAYRAAMKERAGTRSMDRKIDALFARTKPAPLPGYAHVLAFPSTTIGTTENHHVSVVRYVPIAPDRTRMYARTFLLRIEDLTDEERSLRSAVVPRDLAFTARLFEEDRVACERAQRGVEQAGAQQVGVLLPNEEFIARFQEAYLQRMASPQRG